MCPLRRDGLRQSGRYATIPLSIHLHGHAVAATPVAATTRQAGPLAPVYFTLKVPCTCILQAWVCLLCKVELLAR